MEYDIDCIVYFKSHSPNNKTKIETLTYSVLSSNWNNDVQLDLGHLVYTVKRSISHRKQLQVVNPCDFLVFS